MPAEQLPLTGNPADPDERGELIGIGGQYTVHDSACGCSHPAGVPPNKHGLS